MRIRMAAVLACVLCFTAGTALAQSKPNIVLVFMDNFGWGEPGFNGGGLIRGAPTPRLDIRALSSSRVALCVAVSRPLAQVFLTDFRTGGPRSPEGSARHR